MELRFNETLLKGTSSTGIVLNIETQECEARLNGAVIFWHRLACRCEDAEDALKARGVVLDVPAVAPSVPQDATQEAQPVKASKGRCLHYKAIRRAFAIATELGFDTRADEAMRGAFGRFLHRDVPTREVLNVVIGCSLATL